MKSPTRQTSRFAALALALAVLAGGAARFGTADWGLPFAFHVDEKGFVVWEAIYMEHRGLTQDDWRPRINSYGPLIYELAIGVKWLTTGGLARGAEVAAQYEDEHRYLTEAFAHRTDDARPFSFAALLFALRCAAATFGTLAILWLGLAAWTLAGPRAGAITAWLTAAAPGLIQVGHFYTPEALLIGETALVLFACAKIARGGGFRWAGLAGFGLALAITTKGPGVLLALLVPVAIGADDPFPDAPQRATELGRMFHRTLRAVLSPRRWLAAFVCVAFVRIINPWAFTEPTLYFDAVSGNRNGMALLRTQLSETSFGFYDWRFLYNGTRPWLYQLGVLVPYAIGTSAAVAAGVGLVRGAVRLRPIDRLALAASVPLWLLVGPWGVKTIRYALPIAPGLLLAAGALLAGWLRRSPGAHWSRHLVRRGAAGVVILVTCAHGAAFTGMFLAAPDPRIRAAQSIARRARAGDVVVVETEPSYTAPLGSNDDLVGATPSLSPEVERRYLWRGHPPDDAVPEHVRRTVQDARFLVVSDWWSRRASHPAAATRAPNIAHFYEALEKGRTGFVRVATFRPAPRFGPWTFDERAAEILSVAFDHPGIVLYERRGAFRDPFAPAQPAEAGGRIHRESGQMQARRRARRHRLRTGVEATLASFSPDDYVPLKPR